MTGRKVLGKIAKATFGYGGYQDACIGLSLDFSLEGGASGVGTFYGTWGIDRSEHAKWTEEERVRILGETAMKVRDLLRDAGKQHVHELVGVPVEVTFKDYNTFDTFRILKEVL